jgi:putative PIN family toxin of toxin-antitoxin system
VRVVLDTNVLLSACWTPTGLEAKIVTLALSGTVTACVSPMVLGEYRDVLLRPKFAGFRGLAIQTLTEFERTALLVNPTEAVKVSTDDDDNRFLECAVAAKAEFLVTGNLRHYPDSFGPTRIVNGRGFFELSSVR